MDLNGTVPTCHIFISRKRNINLFRTKVEFDGFSLPLHQFSQSQSGIFVIVNIDNYMSYKMSHVSDMTEVTACLCFSAHFLLHPYW